MSQQTAFYDELQRKNRRTTWLLLIGGVLLVSLLVWVTFGFLLGGEAATDPAVAGVVTVLGTAVGLLATYLAYRSGPKIALRAAKAKPAKREEHHQLFNVFDEVCIAAGVSGDEKPTLYIVEDSAPNAFATGIKRDDAHIAVTTGLVEQLPRYELRAVLAHELAHVLNDDIRAVTVAVATAGLVAILANLLARMMWFGGARGGRGRGGGGGGGAAQIIVMVVGLLAIILAPLAAQMIRFAVSRQREYLADATAADLLRDPQSMVNALRRIDGVPHTLQRFDTATAHLWFDEPNETGRGESEAGASHARPARQRGPSKMAKRFATHPSIPERVQRLSKLNAGAVDPDAPLPPPPPPAGGTSRGDQGGEGPSSPPPGPGPFPGPGQGPFPGPPGGRRGG